MPIDSPQCSTVAPLRVRPLRSSRRETTSKTFSSSKLRRLMLSTSMWCPCPSVSQYGLSISLLSPGSSFRTVPGQRPARELETMAALSCISGGQVAYLLDRFFQKRPRWKQPYHGERRGTHVGLDKIVDRVIDAFPAIVLPPSSHIRAHDLYASLVRSSKAGTTMSVSHSETRRRKWAREGASHHRQQREIAGIFLHVW